MEGQVGAGICSKSGVVAPDSFTSPDEHQRTHSNERGPGPGPGLPAEFTGQ